MRAVTATWCPPGSGHYHAERLFVNSGFVLYEIAASDQRPSLVSVSHQPRPRQSRGTCPLYSGCSSDPSRLLFGFVRFTRFFWILKGVLVLYQLRRCHHKLRPTRVNL